MTRGLRFPAYCARRKTVLPFVVLMAFVGPSRAPAVVSLTVDDASASPGTDVFVAVTLTTDGGEAGAAAENDLRFEARLLAPRVDAGEPACTVNPAINKSSTRFGFRPPGCAPSPGSCTAVHAVVIALDNTTPITSGARLYTGNFRIATTAVPGAYALPNGNARYAPPRGGDHDAVAVPGHLTVSGCNLAPGAGAQPPWVMLGLLAWRGWFARRPA